jgi:hypothetical protein
MGGGGEGLFFYSQGKGAQCAKKKKGSKGVSHEKPPLGDMRQCGEKKINYSFRLCIIHLTPGTHKEKGSQSAILYSEKPFPGRIF